MNTLVQLLIALSKRKGEMKNMEPGENGQTRLIFLAPSRGLIGYSTEFYDYDPWLRNHEPYL